jgi:hypothetical protein
MQKTASRLLTNYDIDWGVGWLTGQENNGQKLHAEGARSCFRIIVLVFVLPMPSTLQEDTTYRCLSLSSNCHCLSNFVGQIYCTSHSLSREKIEERNASSCAFPQNVVNLEDRNYEHFLNVPRFLVLKSTLSSLAVYAIHMRLLLGFKESPSGTNFVNIVLSSVDVSSKWSPKSYLCLKTSSSVDEDTHLPRRCKSLTIETTASLTMSLLYQGAIGD